MRAYSVDLRERIMAAVDAGMPRAEAARIFRVSVATIERYRQRRRTTGGLVPGHSPGRTPEIAPAQSPALAAQVAAHPDDTLAQHAATWRAEQGTAVRLWAMGRALVRAKIARNKRRCLRSSATRRRGRRGARTRRRSPRRIASSWTRRRATSR